jgi:hypothetical protein
VKWWKGNGFEITIGHKSGFSPISKKSAHACSLIGLKWSLFFLWFLETLSNLTGSRFLCGEWLDRNSRNEIKTIFDHFRNRHARYKPNIIFSFLSSLVALALPILEEMNFFLGKSMDYSLFLLQRSVKEFCIQFFWHFYQETTEEERNAREGAEVSRGHQGNELLNLVSSETLWVSGEDMDTHSAGVSVARAYYLPRLVLDLSTEPAK